MTKLDTTLKMLLMVLIPNYAEIKKELKNKMRAVYFTFGTKNFIIINMTKNDIKAGKYCCFFVRADKCPGLAVGWYWKSANPKKTVYGCLACAMFSKSARKVEKML